MTMPDLPQDDVEAFFALARDPSANLAPDDKIVGLLQRIAGNGAQTVKFRTLLAGVNDGERKSIIRDLVARVALSLDHEAAEGESWAELLDRYVAPAAGGAVVAGIVALAAGTAAAPWLFGAGVVGLAVAGVRRFWVKATANSDKRHAKLILRLLEEK